MDFNNKIGFSYDSIDEAFPPCDPGVRPSGSRVIVQVRTPKLKTAGGLILTHDVRETELYNTQVGKVRALGPVAFRDRKTLEIWPEGEWFGVGDFVRTPRYGGDRWTVRYGPEEHEEAVMITFNDLDFIGVITGDPLQMKAFL